MVARVREIRDSSSPAPATAKRRTQQRQHAGLHYLTPEDSRSDEPGKRLNVRKEKLDRARKRREEINRVRLQTAA